MSQLTTQHDHPRKLRLVHVYFHLEVGGIETLLVNLLPRIDRQRFETQLICTRRPGRMAQRLLQTEIPIHVCRCHTKIPMSLAMLPLAGLLRRLEADIVHAHAEVPSQFATLAARSAGAPILIANYHSTNLFPYRRQIRRERRQSVFRDATVHVSQSVQRDYVERVDPIKKNGVVIHNGIDVARFAASPGARRLDELRRELKLEGRRPVFLKVARLQRVKAHRDLLRAFARVRAEFPQAVLLLVGEGRRRSSVEEAIRELELGDSVRLLGLRSDVRDLYYLADMHLVSSIKEGFSLVLLEAMAAGLPQVVTDVGSNREAVGDSGAALFAPPGDPGTFSHAMLRVLNDPELSQSMSAAARRRVEQYSVERQVQEIEQLYTELASRKGLTPY
jgi:glycosyltransferase involved in cell wall biosynthesis